MLSIKSILSVVDRVGREQVELLIQKGYSLPQAIELLAAEHEIPLELTRHERQPSAESLGQKRLISLIYSAGEFYKNYLWLSSSDAALAARSYLQDRGIEPATAAAFNLGASPSDNGLSRRFERQGVPASHLLLAGLGYDGGGDVFRSRLMLPVLRSDGKVHGFGGRVVSSNDPSPKYINSPTTLVFDKGHSLYVPPRLPYECLASGFVVLVEGYLDVIAMWQAGFRNVCALMGVASTKGQITRLSKLAPTVVVALDPDFAGEKATYSAARELSNLGLDVRLASLTGGDPDELLRMEGGREYVRESLQCSKPFTLMKDAAVDC